MSQTIHKTLVAYIQYTAAQSHRELHVLATVVQGLVQMSKSKRAQIQTTKVHSSLRNKYVHHNHTTGSHCMNQNL